MAVASHQTEKLSPAEFQQLQDLAAYSNKRISEVLEEEFEDGGCLADYDKNEDIDLPGFQKFLDCFLEVPTPEDLCRHLFLTFVNQPTTSHQVATSADQSKLQTLKSGQTYLGGLTDKLQQLRVRPDRRGM